MGFYISITISSILIALHILVIYANYRKDLEKMHRGDYSFLPVKMRKTMNDQFVVSIIYLTSYIWLIFKTGRFRYKTGRQNVVVIFYDIDLPYSVLLKRSSTSHVNRLSFEPKSKFDQNLKRIFNQLDLWNLLQAQTYPKSQIQMLRNSVISVYIKILKCIICLHDLWETRPILW